MGFAPPFTGGGGKAKVGAELAQASHRACETILRTGKDKIVGGIKLEGFKRARFFCSDKNKGRTVAAPKQLAGKLHAIGRPFKGDASEEDSVAYGIEQGEGFFGACGFAENTQKVHWLKHAAQLLPQDGVWVDEQGVKPRHVMSGVG